MSVKVFYKWISKFKKNLWFRNKILIHEIKNYLLIILKIKKQSKTKICRNNNNKYK